VSALTGVLRLRRTGTARLRRVDTRIVVGLVLVVASVAGGLALFSAADHTLPVMAASRDLPAGHVVAAGDVHVARVRVDAGVLRGLVRGERKGVLIGKVLLQPLAGNGLITTSAVGRERSGAREMTVPITSEHALGGSLRVGDRIEVLATFAKGGKDARTLTVVHEAQVVEVVRTKGILGERAGDLSALTLAVNADEAVYLAFASHTAELDVVRAQPVSAPLRSRFDYSNLP
jgi:Flp pilus assembly protein CpaB